MKKNILIKFGYVLFFVICLLLYFFNLKDKLVNYPSNHLKYYLFFFIYAIVTLSIIVLLIVKIRKNNKVNYSKQYVIFAFILGIIYLVFCPLFTGSDEQSHYYRIYEITDGHLVTPINNENIGSELPVSISETFILCDTSLSYNYNTFIKYKNVIDMIKIPLNKDQKVLYSKEGKYDYVGASLYSPLQYLPHIIGFLIGKALTLNPYMIGMLGRLFNLISCIIICSYGLKLLPKSKTFAFVVLLSPVMLASMTTLSGDGLTNSIIFLFISYILNFMNTFKKITIKEYITISLLVIFISVCKLVYLPVIFLLFLIPKKCFNNNKMKLVYIVFSVFIGIICSAFWLSLTSEYMAIHYPNSILQKEFIFNHIFEYLFIVIRTYCEKFTVLVSNLFVGSELYYSQLPIYSLISISYVVLVIISAFSDNVIKKNDIKVKVFLIIIILSLFGLIATALYVQCTAQFISVGNLVVGGLQGRYYLPILFVLIILFSFKKEILTENNIIKYMLLIQYPVLLTICVHFII